MTPYVGANPVAAVTVALRGSVDFAGRASRSEFWWCVLVYAAVAVPVLILASIVSAEATSEAAEGLSAVAGLLVCAGFIPLLAVAARRMHDSGKSALWLLIGLVPVVGLAVWVWMMAPSQGFNRWGPPAARPAAAA